MWGGEADGWRRGVIPAQVAGDVLIILATSHMSILYRISTKFFDDDVLNM